MVDDRPTPVHPTAVTAAPPDLKARVRLAARLVAAYERRLAPAFVLGVLDDELRRGPTLPSDRIEDLVRRRLDDWLVLGRYPLPDDHEETTHAPTPEPGPWSQTDGT
jgi:hypothetical protein